jgi:hypothetical protein
MDIATLKERVRAGLGAQGYSLDAGALQSESATALAADVLPGGAFRLTPAAEPFTEDDASITVHGTGVDAPFKGLRTELRLALAGGAVQVVQSAAIPAGWKLSAGFPPLAGSLGGAVPFAGDAGTLQLRSDAPAGEGGRHEWVTVTGALDLAGATAGLSELLGVSSVAVHGGAELRKNGGQLFAVELGAEAASRVDLGLFTVEKVEVAVGTELRYNPIRERMEAGAFLGLSATFPFTAAGTPRGLPVAARVSSDGRVRFAADLTDAASAALDEIRSLLGSAAEHVDLRGALPSEGFNLGDFLALNAFWLDLDLRSTPRVAGVGLGIASRSTWTIFTLPGSGKPFAVQNVQLDFRVADPFGARRVDLAVRGEVVLGEAVLALSASSDGQIAARLAKGPLSLSGLLQEFVGGSVAVPRLEVDVFDFSYAGGAYSLTVELDGDWSIDVGPFHGGIQRVRLELERTAAAGPTRVLAAGWFTIAGVDLTVSAALPPDGAGWTFTGASAPGEDISLGKVADWLGRAFGVEVPDAVASFALRDVSLVYVTGSGEITFGAQGSFVLAGKEVDLGLAFHLMPAGTAPAELTVTGSLVVAGQSFTLTFDKTPGVTTFRAEWKALADATGKKNTLGFGSLADLFGFEMPEIPEGLDLALDEASFTYDFANKRLALTAHSTHYGAAVFIADASGPKTRYLFALEVAPKKSLRELPVVGDAIPASLAFSLDDISLWLASAPVAPGETAKLDALIPVGLPKVPAAGLGAGPTLSVTARLGEAVHTLTLGTAAATPAQLGAGNAQLPATASSGTQVPLTGATAQTGAAPAQAVAPQDGTTWLNLQKSIGPLSLQRVGFRYKGGRVTVLLDGGLGIAGVSFSLFGLQVSSALKPPLDIGMGLDGLGLEVNRDALLISGALMRMNPPPAGMEWEYAGLARFKMGEYGIGAVGAFGSAAGVPSMFVFGVLDAPLGGVPAFFVMGLSGGLGINSHLRIPGPNEVQDFPFVAGLGDPAATGGTGAGPLEVLKVLQGTSSTRPGPAWVSADPGQLWVAAGVQFTSFKLVSTRALVVANLGQRDISLALLGISSVVLPPNSPLVFARVEMQLAAVFKPMEGFLGVSAVLSRSSYLLHPSCRLTGGFAFFCWFAGEHAGDFVLSVGGYHPSFTRPAHYPALERLGFNWLVSSQVTIKGGAYFALTPSAIMAGVSLEATFHSGDLRAWFRAGADFLAHWHPFSFEATIGVSVGASYRMDLWLTTVTVSVEIGADLHMWGPPTGGEVYVDWYIISFTIPFGSNAGSRAKSLDWKGFRELLPPDDSLLTLSADGIQKTGAGEWVARPDELAFSTRSAIPASELRLGVPGGTTARHSAGSPLAIRPMNTAGVTTPKTLTVTRDGAVVDLVGDGWSVESEAQRHPEAMWGTPLGDARPRAEAVMLPAQLTGFRVRPPKAHAGSTPGPVDVKRDLSYEPVSTTTGLAFSSTQQGGLAAAPDATTVAAIAAGASGAEADQARAAVFAALGALGVAPATAGSLAGVAHDAAQLFSDPPLRATPSPASPT